MRSPPAAGAQRAGGGGHQAAVKQRHIVWGWRRHRASTWHALTCQLHPVQSSRCAATAPCRGCSWHLLLLMMMHQYSMRMPATQCLRAVRWLAFKPVAPHACMHAAHAACIPHARLMQALPCLTCMTLMRPSCCSTSKSSESKPPLPTSRMTRSSSCACVACTVRQAGHTKVFLHLPIRCEAFTGGRLQAASGHLPASLVS